MATAAPPLPPDVQDQSTPEGAQSAFSAQGVGQPQPGMQDIQAAQKKLSELEKWLKEMLQIINGIFPPLKTHLETIAQAGINLREGMQDLAQRSGVAQGSPVMPQQPPGDPAAGPPMPVG